MIQPTDAFVRDDNEPAQFQDSLLHGHAGEIVDNVHVYHTKKGREPSFPPVLLLETINQRNRDNLPLDYIHFRQSHAFD